MLTLLNDFEGIFFLPFLSWSLGQKSENDPKDGVVYRMKKCKLEDVIKPGYY